MRTTRPVRPRGLHAWSLGALVLLTFAFTPAAHAQTQAVLAVNYCSPGTVTLLADLYLPAGASSPTPIVVEVHAGAWESGNRSNSWALAMYPLLNAAGIGMMSIDYRLAPTYKFPAQIQDVACAVRYLRAHAAEYNINPNEIGIFGESAGAQLALLLGYTSGTPWPSPNQQWAGYSSSVSAVVDWFGPTDLANRFQFNATVQTTIKQTFGPLQRNQEAASPVTYARASSPPTLILHGINDTTVKIVQSRVLYAKLSPATSQFIEVDDAGHNWTSFASRPMNPGVTQIEQDSASWFITHL